MKVVIVGAGGFGREVLAMIKAINLQRKTFSVLGFIDDNIAKGTQIHDLTILGKVADIEQTKAEGVVLAIGNSSIREQVAKALPANVKRPNIIHPQTQFLDKDRILMGEGCIVCAGNIFTTDIKMGDFCIVNLQCTIGHDAELENFVSVMPGVNISGGAKLKTGVYIGTGAKLIKATVIGAYSKVGAGAVVDADIAAHDIVVGIPAKSIKK